MAYCGQLLVKWGRRSLWASGQVVEVELIHAGVELWYLAAARNPVYGNHWVMSGTVPPRGKVQSLVAPLKRDSGVVRVQLLQVESCHNVDELHCHLLLPSTQAASFAHIGHPPASCDRCMHVVYW